MSGLLKSLFKGRYFFGNAVLSQDCQVKGLQWIMLLAPRTMTTGMVLTAPQKVETYAPLLTLDNMNPSIKEMQYAVRGPLVIRAGVIEKELAMGKRKPFDEVHRANIGDPHAVGQSPITFIRQVMAMVAYTPLLDDKSFPEDVKTKVRNILEECKGRSSGAYTDSSGIELVRRHCAQYIERRDGGIESNWEYISLSTGASDSIKSVLSLLGGEINGKKPGVMVQIPQYPLYSATLSEFNMHLIGYYLEESKNWGLEISELERAYDESMKHCNPRAIVVINPGNPTGQVLSRMNIQEIIKFAHDQRLFLFADEVYQDNIYAQGCQFHSFKKVMNEMGPPYSKMELASFMSASKGYMGECGTRAGYVELVNVLPDIRAMFLKSISAKLCPPVMGQVAMDCIVAPPEPGDASYELYKQEKEAVLRSLAERATMVTDAFNSITGMSCNTVQGAMYAFPQFKIPDKAVDKAKELGQEPDTMYAFELLETTGICVVPGSGFGQKSGSYHFRMTILPQPEKLKDILKKFREFHETFVKKYQ